MKKLFTLAIVAMIASMSFAQASSKPTPKNITLQSDEPMLESKGGMMKGAETPEPIWGEWTKKSTGTYTYTQLIVYSEVLDVKVRYATNVEDLAQVQVVDWGIDNPVSLYFEWNTATNECSVPAQFCGHTTPSYGGVYIGDVPTWKNNPDYAYRYPCLYNPQNMTFSLYVAYYVPQGRYAYGVETLTLNAPLTDIPPHVHAWATDWTQAETAHYHACTAEDCGITDYTAAPAEAAYGEHEYGTDIAETAYYTCSVCQYEDAALKTAYMENLANPVEELIDAIGTVSDSYATAKAISDARIAFDKLPEEAQALVENYDDLVAAEELYRNMVSFDSYRNSRSLLLGARLTQFDNAKVRREVADAAQRIQALEYEETLTYAENKKRVDDIYNTYLEILQNSRHDAAVAELFEVAKQNGKASIKLFLGVSDSQRAIDAANEGIAKIDAFEYDADADLSANVDDVFDIVLETKINIVNAWKADFEDLKAEIIDQIRRLIGIGTMPEANAAGMYYDYSLTREENNAKLNEVMQSIGGTTGINAINAATAKNGKYVENGKIVIVKNGKAYTAAGQMK